MPFVTGRRHRKDNSEWGKRMEKELAQIDKRTEAALKQTATSKTKLLSEREADEMAKTGDVNTWSSDSDADVQKAIDFSTGETKDKDQECDRDNVTSNKHKDAVGKKIAKDFGKQGIFSGEVQSVEYDSDDAAQEAPFLVVEYTDGDKEDFNEKELEYGCELALQIALDAGRAICLHCVVHYRQKDRKIRGSSANYRPQDAQMVDVGGPCEGAMVVVQQDNAGPHIEEAYSTWIHDMFDTLGWMYEPQAPQSWLSSYHIHSIYISHPL